MAPNRSIMRAVEQLGYRVTVGDVATRTGLNVNLAQHDLVALASDVSGHLQVAETGEIVYLFPKHFRTILRSKFLLLRLEEGCKTIWNVWFYLIRISLGIILIASIALIFITIAIILIASILNGGSFDGDGGSSGGGSSGGSSGGGGGDCASFFFFNGSGDYSSASESSRQRRKRWRKFSPRQKTKMNFLEATFSFIFGDGNPNSDLEKRRFSQIARVIANNGGAVVAEQIAPYWDKIPTGYDREYETYMLPVLTRFNGVPQVSSEGEIIYYFPDLQVTAQKLKKKKRSVPPYLNEWCWRFSEASSGKIWLALALGIVNCVGALVLGVMLYGDGAMQVGEIVAFVRSIYWVLLGYGVGFLAIPLVRYIWIQWKNRRIEVRNQQREERLIWLKKADAGLHKKMAYAQQFAATHVIERDDIAYTTETDLVEQECDRSQE